MTSDGDLAAVLRVSGKRFFANDNIGDFLALGDVERMEHRAAEAIRLLLDALVIDHQNDHNTRDTPERVARMLVHETFAGRYSKRPAVTAFINTTQVDQCYVVGPIAVRSCCAHHLVPIIGQAWVGVIPDPASLIGLSKHHRLLAWIFERPQIQEEAVEQAAAEIATAIGNPRAVGVIVRAKHLCCAWRGVRDENSLMTTSVVHGLFKEDAKARGEFLDLVKGMGF